MNSNRLCNAVRASESLLQGILGKERARPKQVLRTVPCQTFGKIWKRKTIKPMMHDYKVRPSRFCRRREGAPLQKQQHYCDGKIHMLFPFHHLSFVPYSLYSLATPTCSKCKPVTRKQGSPYALFCLMRTQETLSSR